MNLQNILADVRYLATGDSLNSTDLSDTDAKRGINKYLHQINQTAITAGRGVLAFGEIVKITTVSGQNEYLLTDTDVNLRSTARVYIKVSSSDDYQVSKQTTVERISDISDHQPVYPEHLLLEESLFIFYSGGVQAVENGIMIVGQTDITELSEAADIPEIPEFAVEYATLGAVADFKDSKSMFNDANVHRAKMQKIESMVINHYKMKDGGKRSLSILTENYN